MKVTVSKYLNVRVGAPSLDAPNYQYLAPGSILEVDGKLYEGQDYDGNTLWYKDLAGNYYWSGGIVKLNIPSVDFNSGVIDLYNDLMGLSGRNIKVGILDTGIYHKHPNLIERFDDGLIPNHIRNFSDSSSLGDMIGHGTFISGVIAAQSSNGMGIQGIAPNCKLYTAKVYNDDGSLKADYLINAIDWLLENKVDIVNFSLSTNIRKYNKFKHKIDDLISSGVICVASAGNNNTLFGSEILYPAMHKDIISVGAIDKSFFNKKINNRVDFLTPFKKITSLGFNDSNLVSTESGTSISAAIVTGLIALIIERDSNLKTKDVKNALFKLTTKYIANQNFNSLQILKS